MRKILTILFILAVLAAGCAAKPAGNNTGVAVLTVTDGTISKTYTVETLQVLGSDQASFKDIDYLGVPLVKLLQDAGFDPASLRAVKATGSDGYSVNYSPDLFLLPDTLVSYARTSGPLAEDEAPFRMVLPNAEAKMSVRMLLEIKVIP